PYPYVLMLEQSKNERLLYEYLISHGKDVLWKREVENFSQTEADVTARVKTPDGASQIIEAKHLVGCDGPKSLIRRTLGLSFEGSTFERTFYVADAQVDWHFSHDALDICLSKDTFVVFFPLKGEKRYRILAVFPQEFAKEEGAILYEEIEQRTKEEAKLELDIHYVEWFSTYKSPHTPRQQILCGQVFSCGRFSPRSLTRRSPGYEHRDSGRLQSRLENGVSHARQCRCETSRHLQRGTT